MPAILLSDTRLGGAVTLTSRFVEAPTFRVDTSQGVNWYLDNPDRAGGPDYQVLIVNFRGPLVGAVQDLGSGELTCATIAVEGAAPLPASGMANVGRVITQRVPKRCIGRPDGIATAASALRYDGRGRAAADFAPQDAQGRGVLSL